MMFFIKVQSRLNCLTFFFILISVMQSHGLQVSFPKQLSEFNKLQSFQLYLRPRNIFFYLSAGVFLLEFLLLFVFAFY